MSDHGDMQGAYCLVWKNILLEEVQRVPYLSSKIFLSGVN